MAGSRLGALLAPRSVALIGIPGDLQAPLARPLLALERHGFPGAVYPVNPRHASLGGRPCYPSLAALPETPDVAWVAVPGASVPAVLEECVARGVRHVVVASAGFAETGDHGRARQRAIAERARTHGLTVLGPNSIGFVNVWDRVALTFSTAVAVDALVAGDVAIVSQSGGLGGAVFNRLQDRALGVSYLLSTGNEADVGLEECLEFAVGDARTRAIVLVVEGIRDGAGFRRAAARALDADKPVVALRLGITDVGGRLARSHTGAIVGSHRAWQAVAARYGIVTVADVADVTDVLVWLARAGRGALRRAGVITSSGGAAVHLADRLSVAGFELPAPGAATETALRATLPAYATPANPLDVTAGLPEATFQAAATALATGGDVDALLVPLTMLADDQVAPRLASVQTIARATSAPVALCWLGGSSAARGLALADRQGIACFPAPGGLVSAMTAVRARADARRRWLGRVEDPRPAALPAPGAGVLGYEAACALLERFGVPLPAQALVADAAGAVAAGRRLGYPLALKAVGGDFLHKSDRDGLALGLRDEAELERAARALTAVTAGAACDGLLVQRMVEGVEVAVGVVRDVTFGALLMVGPGGTAVELSGEHQCLPLPATAEDVRAALDAVPSFRRLRGYRHEPPRDRDALVDAVVRVGRLALALGDTLRELDLNPVIVGAEGKGVAAVDVLVVLDG